MEKRRETMGLTQGMQKATLFLREELRRAKQAIAAQEKTNDYYTRVG